MSAARMGPPEGSNGHTMLAEFTGNENEPPEPCGGNDYTCPKFVTPGDESTGIYVGDARNPNKGRWICVDHVKYYKAKTAQTEPSVQRTSLDPPRGPEAPYNQQVQRSQRGQNIDVRSLEASSNRAQRRGSGFLHRQSSTLPVNSTLGPWGGSSQHSGQLRTPIVGAPNVWSSRPGDYAPASQAPSSGLALGYTPVHPSYEAERARRGRLAHAADILTQERIDLLVTFVREVPTSGAKAKREVIANIEEGIPDVSALAFPQDIVKLAISVIRTRVETMKPFRGFTFRWNEMVVRSLPHWVDILRMDKDQPVYYHQCLSQPASGKAANKSGTPVFKKPTTAFKLHVVMSADHWLEWEEHDARRELAEAQARKELDITSEQSCDSARHPKSRPKRAYSPNIIDVDSGLAATKERPQKRSGAAVRKIRQDATLSDSEDEIITSTNHGRPAAKIPAFKIVRSAQAPQSTRSASSAKISEFSLIRSAQATKNDKSISLSGSSHEPDNADQNESYKSPNIERIRQGLLRGGSKETTSNAAESLFGIPGRPVQFYYIPQHLLSKLIDSDAASRFSLEGASYELGTLRYDQFSCPIGIGASKTAHVGYLALQKRVINHRLSSSTDTAVKVAVKRIFTREKFDRQSGQEPPRYTFEDEVTKTLTEANLIYWASSLMRDSYAWIKREVEARSSNTNSESPLPFIPDLQFVHAGVALVDATASYKQRILKSGKPSASAAVALLPQMAVLLEELINVDEHGPFVKYINNGSAANIAEKDSEAHQIGEFLCFIQHLQYLRTDRMAYTSDFQGAGSWLTDPQIMTSPELIQSVDEATVLFGSGNVESAFTRFPEEHQCNVYCAWFKLDCLI